MSYLLKLIQIAHINRSLTRPIASLSGNILANHHYKSILPSQAKAEIHSARSPPHDASPPPHGHRRSPDTKKIDDIKYEIKFKNGPDLSKIIKDSYQVYGPLFIVCHIGISLTSLGIFSSIVFLTVNPLSLLPDFLLTAIGNQMTEMTTQGSKFVLAYAMHKLILPIRLFGSIWLTKLLSPWFRSLWNKKN